MKQRQFLPLQAKDNERGVALLTVLLLVAVMSVIAANMLERTSLGMGLSRNAAAKERIMLAFGGAELLVTQQMEQRLKNSPARITNDGNWIGRPFALPMPGGDNMQMVAQIFDGGNCFNLNALVIGGNGQYKPNPAGAAQFLGLARALGIADNDARGLADALTDWIDSDDAPMPYGAEDGFYSREKSARRTSGQLFIHASEAMAVKGMTAPLYERLSPWLCALPDTALSPLNVNTLAMEQAPLLAMLDSDNITLDDAKRLIVSRPEGGYGRLADFWAPLARADKQTQQAVERQLRLTTTWFLGKVTVKDGDMAVTREILLDARQRPVKIAYSLPAGYDDEVIAPLPEPAEEQ